MKRTLKFTAIGLIALSVFVLARLPASFAFARMPAGQVVATGVSGTIWRGRASALLLRDLQLGETSWRFEWSGLLQARLSYEFATTVGGEALRGSVSSGRPGVIRLTNVEGRIPLQELSAYVPTAFLSGIADVNLEDLRIRAGWPTHIDGQLRLVGLTALTTRPHTPLGDYQLIFSEQKEMPLTATLADLSGPIELSGSINIDRDRSFTVNATLLARPDAPPQISSMLAFVGPEDQQGRRKLQYSGKL